MQNFWPQKTWIFWSFLDIFKGRPKLRLCVTTVEHGRFRYLCYVFGSCITNHRRQKCAFVISLEMKTATIQHYPSGKWLHRRHDVFQTRVNDFNVDLKLIDSFFFFKWNANWPKFVGKRELWIFVYNASLKHVYAFRVNYESKNQHGKWRKMYAMTL